MKPSLLGLATVLVALVAAGPSFAATLYTAQSAPRAHVAVLSVPVSQLPQPGRVTIHEVTQKPPAQSVWITGVLPTRCNFLGKSPAKPRGCLVV